MSKKNVSAIVSGAGWISGFWHLMDKEMRRQGWTVEQIHALVTETADPEDQPIAKIVQALQMPEAKKAVEPAAIKPPVGFAVTYDQSLGLKVLIERAVGPNNLDNINRDITPERFPLKGTDVRQVKCRVEAYISNETREEAAQRLMAEGHKLASTGDLAGFLYDHPDEVAKWYWVDAVSEDSRWADSFGSVCVPYAHVYGTRRCFRLYSFRRRRVSGGGFLVLCE